VDRIAVQLLSPGQAAQSRFRRKFIAGLRRLFATRQLSFFGECIPLHGEKCFANFLCELRRQDWVVYAKPPFGGPEHVLHYLARYTHRVAISNHRLLAVSASEVCFRWKDYAHDGKQRTMTLTPQEFLRRFVQHVLPRGFPRIRYFGWLSNRLRSRILPLCRARLNQAPPAEVPPTAKQLSWNCTHCQGLMQPVEKLSAAQLFFAQRKEGHVLDSS
jgi:Putative transposase